MVREMTDANKGIGVTGRSAVSIPTAGSTVIREAFDAAFTMYFSDHSALRITGGFTLSGMAGAEEIVLSPAVADLKPHASELTSLIGQTVDAATPVAGGSVSITFTSGVRLSLASDRTGP